MKRILLTVIASLAIVGAWAQSSQTEKVYNNQLLIAPFYLLDETFMLSYERIFTDNGALRITPSVTLSNVNNGLFDINDSYRKNREGFGIELAYKALLFPTDRVFNVHFGPYVLYRYVKNTYESYTSDLSYSSYLNPNPTIKTERFNVMGAGIDTGIKLTMGRFILDFTVGGGLRYPANNSDFEIDNSASDIFDDNFKGIAPRVNFFLGVAL